MEENKELDQNMTTPEDEGNKTELIENGTGKEKKIDKGSDAKVEKVKRAKADKSKKDEAVDDIPEDKDEEKDAINDGPVVKRTESVEMEEDDDLEISDVKDMQDISSKKPRKSSDELKVDKHKVNKAKNRRNNRALKKLRKWLIIAAVLGAIIFVIVRYLSYSANNLIDSLGDTTTYATVERMDLASTISTTGTVQSKDVRTLTSALNGVTIDKVNYKVGDMVEEGSVVVSFSREDISKKIANLQEDITEAEASLALTNEYKAREHEYDYGTADYNNYTASVKTEDAQISVEQAQRDLDAACAEKAAFVEDYNTAMANIGAVTEELDALQVNYNMWKQYYSGGIPRDDTPELQAYWYYTTDDAFQDRISELNSLKVSYQNTIDLYESKITSYTTSITNAQDKLLSAQRTYTATAASESETNRNTSNNVYISDYNYAKDSLTASDSLNKLIREMEEYEASLDDYIVFAPISGMVTTVNAQEGNGYTASTGALMTIQAVDVFEVTTQIDEYDINNVQIGQRVVIMTDATGDDELEGTVTFISPTATAGTSGNTYEVDIDITTRDSRIKLGMSAKLNIILDSHSDILAVRYDAVEETANGEKVVYVVDAPSPKRDFAQTPSGTGNSNGIVVEGQDGAVSAAPDGERPSFDGEMPDMSGNKKQSFWSYLFDFSSDDNNMPTSGLSSAAKKVKVEVGIEGDYYTEIISNEISEGMSVMVKSNNENSSNPFGAMFGGGMGGGFGGGDMGGGPDGAPAGGPGM